MRRGPSGRAWARVAVGCSLYITPGLFRDPNFMQNKATLAGTKFCQEGLGDNSFGKVLLSNKQEAILEGMVKRCLWFQPWGN